ncbi:hypothetical protein ACFFRR_005715 [Megaselia abdita]
MSDPSVETSNSVQETAQNQTQTSNQNSDNKKKKKKTTKKSSKSKICTTLINVILCCLLILPILGSNFNISNYNMTTYSQRAQQLNFLTSRAKLWCKQIVCKESIKQLDLHIEDIVIMNKLIKKECQLTEFQRTMLLEILLRIFSVCCDSRYATKVEDTFRNLKSN